MRARRPAGVEGVGSIIWVSSRSRTLGLARIVVHLVVDLRDDRGRRASRRDQGIPCIGLSTSITAFLQRRHARQEVRALRRRHRENFHLTASKLRVTAMAGRACGLHVATDHAGDRLR